MLHDGELDEKRAGVLATISFGRVPTGRGTMERTNRSLCDRFGPIDSYCFRAWFGSGPSARQQNSVDALHYDEGV